MVREKWVEGAVAASLGISVPSRSCGGCKLLPSSAKQLSSVTRSLFLNIPKGAGFHSTDIFVTDCLGKLNMKQRLNRA